MQETQTEEKKKAEGRFSSELFSWGESLMTVLIFFVVVFTFFVRLIGVDGTSMYPTLEDHSIMLVSNLNYTPEKGDIVVLRKEGFYGDQPIVKRIIATEGQTVDIDFDNGYVYVDGQQLDESAYIENGITRDQYDVEFPQTVPEGHVFVLGDNRTVSKDSRDSEVGMIDQRCIIGKVQMIYQPFSEFGWVS